MCIVRSIHGVYLLLLFSEPYMCMCIYRILVCFRFTYYYYYFIIISSIYIYIYVFFLLCSFQIVARFEYNILLSSYHIHIYCYVMNLFTLFFHCFIQIFLSLSPTLYSSYFLLFLFFYCCIEVRVPNHVVAMALSTEWHMRVLCICIYKSVRTTNNIFNMIWKASNEDALRRIFLIRYHCC